MGLEKGCPCCKVYEDGLEFKKVMHLENAGLVVYRHTAPANSVASVSQPEKTYDKKDNVFIIQNTKNKDVSISNYMPEFEQAINCPRCRYIAKHTKEFLVNIPFIKKNDVIGICDHCRFKKRIFDRCTKCQVVVKQFLKRQEQKQSEKDQSEKYKKVFISKIKDILIDAPVQIEKSKTQTRSDKSLKNVGHSYTRSPTYHVPRVKDMFDTHTKTEKTQHLKKLFLKGNETTRLYKTKSDSEITFIEDKRHQEHYETKRNILFNSTENIVWPESVRESEEFIRLDKKHEHRLRRKPTLKTEVDLTFKRLPIKGQENYLKEEKYTLSKEILTQIWPSEESVSIHENENIKDKKKYQKSYDDVNHSKYEHEDPKSSQKGDMFVRGIQKQSRSVYNIRRYSSEETLQRSASSTTEQKLHKDFSYFFLKETDVVKKPLRKRVSSSELIKDTQDMYRARAEEERIKKEQELKLKLEAEEKKRLAKIERKERLEEERRSEELRKKMAEDEKNKLKKIEEEQDLNKKQSLNPDKESIGLKEKIVKTSKEPSEKSKSIKLKESKIDRSLKSDKDSGKSKKEIDKQEKEELMRLEKERKLREKSEKEEQMRSAKEKQKEEKEREKERKEEEMRRAKDEKQKQKEEKEREKEKKEEEMRRAKDEKQRQKEESEREKAKKADEMRLAKEDKQKEKEEKEKLLKLAKEQQQREKEEKQKEKEERDKIAKENEERLKQKQREQQLLDDQLKKSKESKMKKKQDEEANKQDAQLRLKSLKDTKPEVQPDSPPSKKVIEEPKIKELNINQVKIRKNSPDDLILQLVRLKQTKPKERPTRMSQLNIPNKTLKAHKGHKNLKTDSCIICLNSDLELDIENIVLNEKKPKEVNDIIIGSKIFKYKPSLVAKKEEKNIIPLIFSSTHAEDENNIKKQEVIDQNVEDKDKKPPNLSGMSKNKSKKTAEVEQEVPKGVIRYALSDRTFIEKGWTMLPTEKVVRKMNIYRMRPAHPEFDWFEHNKNRKLICYDTGEKLAEFDDKGKGRWFYRSGRVALDYYDAEEINAQQRIIIFSSGEPDERGCSRPLAILATFDYLGNGIVFDHSGKIRLKYNQTEGVVLDRAIGPVSHWKWHTLNDPPVLQQVMIDTQMAHKDPDILKLGGPHDDKPRPDNEEMLAIEFDNFIKEKSKKLSQKFKPFQIKMKALKINEYFSLKVLDQATIYLIYRDGSTNLKLNIGMILDHQEIVDTDTAEVGEVSNSLERFPARTDSLAGLQKSVAHAQRVERARVERSQRLRPTQPCASADLLVAGLSRPRPVPPELCACKCRKPSSTNLYYDTRLI